MHNSCLVNAAELVNESDFKAGRKGLKIKFFISLNFSPVSLSCVSKSGVVLNSGVGVG